MKRTITLVITGVLFTMVSHAQVPEKMSYQAVIRNSVDQLVINQLVRMRISILLGTATGTAVYVETQTPSTNANGLVSIEIGSGTPVTGSFGSVNWSTGLYFIKTETDPSGGINYSIVVTSQILSVPYALYAQTSGNSADAVKITGDQSIAGTKTFTGIISASNKNIKNVAVPIDPTDAVNKAYVDALKDQVQQLQADAGVTDVDGNHYKAIKIGSQVWMAENLKTTKFRDGTSIPNITDGTTWAGLTSFAYSDFGNNVANGTTYGHLYNYFTVLENKLICPVGWHAPSEMEWTTLIDYLGGGQIAAAKLRESGTTHWSLAGGDNSSGFTALAGSWRGGDGIFYYYVGQSAWWWSNTFHPNGNPLSITIGTDNTLNYYGDPYHTINAGNSIRCIKD